MKNAKTLYWIVTGLFSAFMLFTAIPDLMLIKEAEVFMREHLGYPNYFTRFIGAAKMIGAIALLIPKFKKIKEWAYAGLGFDLIGAVFSILIVDGINAGLLFIILPLLLGAYSYYLNEKVNSQS